MEITMMMKTNSYIGVNHSFLSTFQVSKLNPFWSGDGHFATDFDNVEEDVVAGEFLGIVSQSNVVMIHLVVAKLLDDVQ